MSDRSTMDAPSNRSSALNCSLPPWSVIAAQPVFALEATSVALGLFAMTTNAAALRLFCQRPRHRSAQPGSPFTSSPGRLSRTLRRLLLLLCLAESGFTLSFCAHTIFFTLLHLRPIPSIGILHLLLYGSLFFYFTANVCIPVRNWCILLIAVSRFEVVAKPFARQQGKVCTSRRLMFVLGFIGVISIALTVPRLFDEQWTTCHPDPSTSYLIFRRLPGSQDLQNLKWSLFLVYFTLQSLIPPFAVVLLSMAMIACLRRRRRASALTRAVLLLLVLFGLLESAQFVLAADCLNGVYKPECELKAASGNLLVVLDSCANFFVYMCTTAEVRAYTSSMLLRRRSSGPIALEHRTSISCTSLRPRQSSVPSAAPRKEEKTCQVFDLHKRRRSSAKQGSSKSLLDRRNSEHPLSKSHLIHSVGSS